MAFIATVEDAVAGLVGPGDIRCRVSADGIRLELPPALLDGQPGVAEQIDRMLAAMCSEQGRSYAGMRAYRRGSAFLLERPGPAGMPAHGGASGQ